MKKLYLIVLIFFLTNCGSNAGGTVVTPPDEIKKPVAVDDTLNATEDEEFKISGLLTNDTVENNARITSFDKTTSKDGTIEDNRDGTYTYSPKASFVGDDTFTYTLCDTNTPKNCSTATVTITVVDEGSPTANNDTVTAPKNVTITIDNFTENDDLQDDASVTSIDASSSSGSVTLDNDGKILYTPANNFIGEDSFTYTICDDDTPNAECSTATITVTIIEPIAFNIPSNLQSYYTGLGLTSNQNLNFDNIRNLTTTKHTRILSYGERHNYLYHADEDLANTANVILMYTGESRDEREYTSGSNSHTPQTFNTEHIYPQSKLSASDAVSDLHHLRACDASVNSERSNFPFTDGSGSNTLVGGNKWYPGDDWRGDVARMIFYLNVRYGETFEKVGTLALFLKWNKEDPVSDFEIQRNNIIQGAQGNRNPFIDNPYIATLIWGGNAAENKWE